MNQPTHKREKIRNTLILAKEKLFENSSIGKNPISYLIRSQCFFLEIYAAFPRKDKFYVIRWDTTNSLLPGIWPLSKYALLKRLSSNINKDYLFKKIPTIEQIQLAFSPLEATNEQKKKFINLYKIYFFNEYKTAHRSYRRRPNR